MTGLFVSTMRTGVPLVAGWVLTLAVRTRIDIDSTTVVSVVTIILAFIYYLTFRLLELLGKRLPGGFIQNLAGVFLGWARPPSYPKVEALEPVDGARYLSSGSASVRSRE
ncbi:MAG TPA: hypothetical protein VIU15_38530 [Streptomyces sp.]